MKSQQNIFSKFDHYLNINSIQVLIRKFGSFMVGMIIPMVGVIIAWGIITSLFVSKTSPTYHEGMAKIIGPGIRFIIPSLIGWFGGYQIYKVRGGLIGVLATLGTIIGAETDFYNQIAGIVARSGAAFDAPIMILGAMIAAPIAAIIFKKLEQLWLPKVPQGFEMLINNFALGIIGCLFCLASFWGVTAIVGGISRFFMISIDFLRTNNLMILSPIFFEPARLMFLNNALDYGIFTPLAISDLDTYSKSAFYLFIPNPGPGLGLLLAFYFFSGNKNYKAQSAAAMPIHFIGGIHEVYFPFAWIKPITIPFLILSSMFNVWIYDLFNVGSISNNSPGSVISVYSFLNKTAKDYTGLSISVFGSALIVLLTVGPLLFFQRIRNGEKIFWNPVYALLNAKYQNQKNFSLREYNNKRPFASIKYQVISTNKKYLIEKIEYENANNEIDYENFFLPKNHSRVIQIKYLEIYKKKWYQRKPQKVTYLIQTMNKVNKIIAWKNQILAKLEKQKIQSNQILTKHYGNKFIKKISYSEKIIPKLYAHITFKNDNKNSFSNLWRIKFKKIQLAYDHEKISLEDLNKKIIFENVVQVNNPIKKEIRKIVFACEAGMGSSAMGASLLKKLLLENNLKNINIVNLPIKDLTNDFDVVVTQKMFIGQAKQKAAKAHVYTIDQFLDKKGYFELIKLIAQNNQ